MNITLPNGNVIEDIPDGISKDDVMKTAISSGLATVKDFNIKTKKSNWIERFGAGARDPIVGGGQFLYNSLPDSAQSALGGADKWLYENSAGYLGNKTGDLNKEIRQREAKYQSELPEDEGFDEARFMGNMFTGAVATKGMGAPQSFVGSIPHGAAMGGAFSASNPVTSEDYWDRKQSEMKAGALFGGAMGPVGVGVSRLVMPKSVKSQPAKQLKDAGIDPTMGQTLGGFWNNLEQKAQSVPILGDAILYSRGKARDQFNNATMNKVLKPIGGKTSNIGTQGADDVSSQISKAYDDAISTAPGIKLDDVANRAIKKLKKMTSYMSDEKNRQFNKIYNGEVKKKLSPSGGMISSAYKKMDSVIGKKATTYKGTDLGDALTELRSIFNQQARRTNPDFARKMKKADAAYARQASLKNAVNKASLQGGVFTPGQLIQGIKTADRSLNKTKNYKGKMPMQKFAVNAQKHLGDTYPESGTPGRIMAATLMGGGAGHLSPPLLGGLLGGASAYTPQAQNMFYSLLTKRPDLFNQVSQGVSKYAPLLSNPLTRE